MTRSRLAITMLVLLAACGGGSSPTGSNNDGNGGNNGGGGGAAMTATINGTAWSSTISYRATWGGNVISITGSGGASLTDYTVITMAVTSVTAAGTYPLSFGNTQVGLVNVVNGTSDWSTGFPGGVGTLIISSLTATHVTGTFSFTAIPASTSSATDTLKVTNGKFDMDIQ
jgi:Family of unknown function (DUF6252)